MNYPIRAFQDLVDNLYKLPGIGPKTAERLSLFILNMEPSAAREIGQAILELHDNVKRCPICYNLSNGGPCWVCQDIKRDHNVIMVVEEARDVLAIEKASTFKGVYHVLGGTIRLAQGMGPEKLNISSLLKRIVESNAKEVILATNLTHEGNLTAMYIRRELEKSDCTVTRIASGIPIGTEIEFADTITLSEAIKGRTSIDKE